MHILEKKDAVKKKFPGNLTLFVTMVPLRAGPELPAGTHSSHKKPVTIKPTTKNIAELPVWKQMKQPLQ